MTFAEIVGEGVEVCLSLLIIIFYLLGQLKSRWIGEGIADNVEFRLLLIGSHLCAI